MDLKNLETENRRLRQEIDACHEQGRLFESLLKMVGSASEKEALIHTMQKTLDITARLSRAQTGSLFLLDARGLVTDSILTRGEVGHDLKTKLVGTVLDKGLAGWVRQHLKPGLVHDTQTDSRWVSLPDEPYEARSVLSVPIIKNDAVFGILTLMHADPHFFSQEDVDGVQVTADHMALAIEGAQVYVRLEELNRQRRKVLERDLSLARQVQESFLPAGMPTIEGYGFGAVNRPALAVGGDFYYFYPLPGNRLGVALGDVSGKGIAASLFMARLSSELVHFAPVFIEPGRLLAKLNQELCARSKQGMFVTLVYLVLDLNTGIVLCANAGHLPPMVMDQNSINTMPDEGAKGPPLGILPDAVYSQQGFSLDPGSRVVLFTDGVIEARNRQGEIFGFERLGRELARHLHSGPEELVSGVIRAVDQFSLGRDGRDDLTMVCFQRKTGFKGPGCRAASGQRSP